MVKKKSERGDGNEGSTTGEDGKDGVVDTGDDGGDGDDGDDGGGKAVVEAGGDNDGHPPINDNPPGAVIDAHALVQVDLPALTECLHELTRQMCVDCRERGDLAQRSWYVEK
jgi:hypothetical protein